MPTTKKKQTEITVHLDHHARGHIGPCEGQDCQAAATRVYDIWIDDVHARTWVCDTHAAELEHA